MGQNNPGDKLISAGRGILNGDNAKQSVADGAKRFFGGSKDEKPKTDPDWHNDMVNKANDSFKNDSQAAAVDPKAAVAKMHPQHVHQLVQDAHAGKFGPEAQKVAQSAMQPTAEAQGAQNSDQPGQTAKPNYAKMFSVTGQEPQEQDDPDQAVPAGRMFSGR